MEVIDGKRWKDGGREEKEGEIRGGFAHLGKISLHFRHDAVAVSVVGDTDDLVLGEYGAVERVLELDDGGRAAG